MLDVIQRSQRGRICEYRRNNEVLNTPAVLSMTGCDQSAQFSVSLRSGKRYLILPDGEICMDVGMRTTVSSGIVTEISSVDGVSIIRIPFKENDVKSNTEIAIVANAAELRNDPRKLIDAITRVRGSIGYGALLYLPGIADPSNLAMLVYMGVDIVDDAYPKSIGTMGMKCIPEGEVLTGNDESVMNAEEMQRELSKVRDYLNAGRLRELVDQRAPSSPKWVALLRLFDSNGYVYQEEACQTIGGRFCCNTTQSLLRPEVRRYRNVISERYQPPKHKKVLVLLPCSAKKPYHISKSHRAFSSAIHTGDHDTLVHEVIVTSPLGIVPMELDVFFPASSYDIPVTGEWKCQEEKMIRSMVEHLLENGYEHVISHLGDTTELIRGLTDLTETVVGDPVSPVSLSNLESAIKDACKGMEIPGYHTDRCENVRSILTFQFGKEAADVLMDGTDVIGKFPYWKMLSGKEQIGMLTPERGMISLTAEGARRLATIGKNIVEMTDFEFKGNLFAVGVSSADPEIRIGDEAIVMLNGDVKAVGVAQMSGREMCDLSRGIAVKIRHKSK